MRRRLAIIISCGSAGALLALAALPWWLGSVARGIASHYGAQFARYERIGYAHFALHDVSVALPTVKITVDRAETETPLLWLFHRVTKKPATIEISAWSVIVTPRIDAPPSSGDTGALHTRAILFHVADGLERWAPVVELGRGTVRWPGASLQFDAVRWNGRMLNAPALRYAALAGNVELGFTRDEIQLKAGPLGGAPWSVSLKNARDEITGELRAWDQSAALSARLPAHGWMPTSAELNANGWAIPAAALKLGDAYSAVKASALLEWKDERFVLNADGTGEVSPGKKAPPLRASVHATGNIGAVTIDALMLDIPGAAARLSAPMTFTHDASMAAASHFSVEIDLAKQPWLPGARGRVVGGADISAVEKGFPRIEANLEARDVVVADWAVESVALGASLDWPSLTVKRAVVGFAEGGQLTAQGGWDFKTGEVTDGTIDGVIRPSLLRRWLPEKVGFETLKITAKASGPVAALRHEGNFQLTAVAVSGLHPLAVSAAWRGEGRTIEISSARLQAGESRVEVAGSLNATGAQMNVFKFSQGSNERLALTQPTIIRWSPRLEMESLRLAGADEAELTAALSAGESGRFEIGAKAIASEWLGDFATLPGPEWRASRVEARGDWKDGPATFVAQAQVAVTLPEKRTAQVTVDTHGDASGVTVDRLDVAEGNAPIVNASGHLPLAFHPRANPFIKIDPNGSLTLKATTATNPAFWGALASTTGVEFQEPVVNVELSGTWSRPKGQIGIKAARVTADSQRVKFSLPALETLDIHANADNGSIVLDRFAVLIERQAVRARGKLAFDFNQWDELKRAPLNFVRREGNLELEIPPAEIAAFARFLPASVAPMGHVQIDAAIKPGGAMSGTLRLSGASTRPLGPLGVLQEIEAEAEFHDRAIEVKNLAARSGGQPVTVTGKIQLPLDAPPKYDLALKGENLPLVRQTGLLLRADLDLKLTSQSDPVPEVNGTVRLRDSMFLSDIRALIPRGGGGTGPARRPPFFAVEDAPLNAWRLAIDVRGDEFLRLRSAVFVGAASARFHLGGTLGEPRATGDATVEEGQVLLPFASFRVEQGTVRLTEADPYSLQLFLTGTSRRYGYDLRMEMTGTAAAPIVTFSSNPPLEAKQVLMMVTAGETPQDEVTYSGAQRVTRLGAYLGQSLINNFGGDATDADRLSISSGERVSRQGRETYEVEYRLSDRFTAVGEYDEFDDYNAGVKWRMIAPPSQKKKAAEKPSLPVKTKEPSDALPH